MARRIHLSLGAAQYREQVSTAIARLSRHDITLLACIAEYPVQRPLDLLDNFTEAQRFGLPVGVSSHLTFEDALATLPQAVRWGATVIEMHLRTAATPAECPDNGPWALYPEQFAKVVEAIRCTS